MPSTVSRMGRRANRRSVAIVGCIVIITVAASAGAAAWGHRPWRTPTRSERLCASLSAEVGGLRTLSMSNGPGQASSEWLPNWWGALANDPFVVDRPSTRLLRQAVQRDRAGFERVRRSAPDDAGDALDRMRRLALDSDQAKRVEHTPQVERDARQVGALGRGCHGLI